MDLAGSGIYGRFAPEPARTSVSFRMEGHAATGDLYLSPAGARAGLLLLPGAAEEGKDDPRLVSFARTLARARFAVLVPDLPSFRSLLVHAGNIQEVADAAAWLSSRPDLAPGGEVGLAAFSYAAGPAILAALTPEIRERVSFILAVGPYYDLPQVLTFFTTGWFRLDGRWRYLEPNAYGKWVFVLSNLPRISPQDREIVRRMAGRRMNDPGADLSDLVPRLSPAGRDLHAFATNTDPRAAPRLMQRLPPEIRRDIAALDLANKDLSRLKARLLLVHGTDDAIIPFSQSVELSRAAPTGTADLFLVEGLQHVELTPRGRDLWYLWRAVDAVLVERNHH